MEKNKTTNRWLLGNLFWIVPLNFILILAGFSQATMQRSKSIQNQEVMQRGIKTQLVSDSLLKKKQDSLLQNTTELRNLIKK